MLEIYGKYTNAKIMIDNIDQETVKQITNFVNNESFSKPVAIMPDCHAGKGAVIGFTMPIADNIIPNIVGVDIACGVLTANVGKKLFNKIPKDKVDKIIRFEIPMGHLSHESCVVDLSKCINWTDLNKKLYSFTTAFNDKFGTSFYADRFDETYFEKLSKKVGADYKKAINQIGTLGGGNHFIEIGRDKKGFYYITIHSGSRNFGKCVADYWQDVAKNTAFDLKKTKQEYEKFVKQNFPKTQWNTKLREFANQHSQKKQDNTLAYLEYENMYNYLVDMIFVQRYSSLNRKVMMDKILKSLEQESIEEIECVHNYINFDDWIIRKGAISSHEGEVILIPLNMKDGMLICKGKGNSEWNYSAPHGAGRILSRSKAKTELNYELEKESMKGIYTTCIPLDEAPSAYKDSKIIEQNIGDTCEIINRITPIINIKGA